MTTTGQRIASRISGSARRDGAHRGLQTVLVTKSLPTEVAHDQGNVGISGVQMAGVNTAQFSWDCSRRARLAQPVAPVCRPEVAARAVADAAQHPTRKRYWTTK
jgi:hypothetical protein